MSADRVAASAMVDGVTGDRSEPAGSKHVKISNARLPLPIDKTRRQHGESPCEPKATLASESYTVPGI